MNKLLSLGNSTSQLLCPSNIQEGPSIEYIQYEPGEKKEHALTFTHIILITEGSFLLSYDHFLDHKVDEGKIILLPPGAHFTVRIETRVSILVFRMKEAIRLCEGYDINNILSEKLSKSDRINSLEIKPAIANFISFLIDNLENGLCHEEYLKLKAEELLYLVRSYYPSKELRDFFFPLLSTNAQFHQFVLKYYRKVKTVKEFAELNKCSVSNFDKKFKETFGTSTYQWMQQKKVDLLYHEINATDKSLREIAREQKFLSLPQFSDYCKKHFGYPPGKMRKLASMFRSERSIL